MSFDIHWDALDDAAAAAAQRFLNERFQHLPSRPAFLGDVTIQQLSFGSVPPSLELVDITEPYADFYLAGVQPRPCTVVREAGAHARPCSGQDFGAVSQPNGPVKRGEMDLQATLRFEYKGDFTLQVATELQVNYPTEHFAALPVTVTVTEIACSGTLPLLRPRDGPRTSGT